MSNESIISKTQLINQGYGSVLSNKETTDIQPRPMPRLSHRRNKYNLENANVSDALTDNNSNINLNVIKNINQQSSRMASDDDNNNNNDSDGMKRRDSKSENRLIQQPSNDNVNEKKPLTNKGVALVTDESKLMKDNQYNKNILMKPLRDPESANVHHQHKQRPYPKYVFFIICNEFCERFSFYGLRAILVLYFRNVLGFSDSSSTISFHLFMTLCYFTPIFGAILGDSILGKYRTIMYLSSVYFIGELLLVISSIVWDNHGLSVGLTIFSLILIGGGTGGIKPCVSALSGDQFLTSEQKRIQNFFSMFYFSINAGSLISTFLTPVLRNDIACHGRSDCFPLAFGVPCILMFVGLIFFVLAKSNYVIVPLPKDNVLVSFVKSIYYALNTKWARKKSRKTRGRPIKESSSSDVSTLGVNTVPTSSTSDINTRLLEKTHWIYYSLDKYDKTTLDEFRSVLGVLVLFLPLPVFWCLFDQQSSRWTLQATRMDGHIFGYNMKPDQIQMANPLLLLSLIPVFDLIIYPLFDKCAIIKTPLQRMITGGILAGLTFFASAIIEQKIDSNSPISFVPASQGHLTITNGMSNCELVYPSFFIDQSWGENQSSNWSTAKPVKQQLSNIDHLAQASLANQPPSTDQLTTSEESSHLGDQLASLKFKQLSPLESKSLGLLNDNISSYKMMFNLQSPPAKQSDSESSDGSNKTTTSHSVGGCPLDNDAQFNVSLPQFGPESPSKLLYIYQGNAEVKNKVFDDNIAMPPAGYARVKIIMDVMATVHPNMGTLSIVSPSSASKQNFQIQTLDNQLLSTEYLDVDAQNQNEFTLLFPNSMNQAPINVKLEPGSRNLILAHEYEPKKFTIKLQQLQDNKYMISVLWQLIPYLGISAGEVMFSITGLEFSYSVAPKSMKSIILGAWFLTTAFGNLLTVAIESMHIFTSVATEFYFYGILMILDMVIFAWLAYCFQPTNVIGRSKSGSGSLDSDASTIEVQRTIDSGFSPTHISPKVISPNVISPKVTSSRPGNNNVGDTLAKPKSVLSKTVGSADSSDTDIHGVEFPSTKSTSVSQEPQNQLEKTVRADDNNKS